MWCASSSTTKEGPIEAQATTRTAPEFTLANRRGSKTVRGRRESIQVAKKMSRRGGPTTVRREDGNVDMTFNGGNLVKYHFITRGRRHRGRR